jgi:hypothetical protein
MSATAAHVPQRRVTVVAASRPLRTAFGFGCSSRSVGTLMKCPVRISGDHLEDAASGWSATSILAHPLVGDTAHAWVDVVEWPRCSKSRSISRRSTVLGRHRDRAVGRAARIEYGQVSEDQYGGRGATCHGRRAMWPVRHRGEVARPQSHDDIAYAVDSVHVRPSSPTPRTAASGIHMYLFDLLGLRPLTSSHAYLFCAGVPHVGVQVPPRTHIIYTIDRRGYHLGDHCFRARPVGQA